jgi:hypothetical protein
MPSTPIPPTLDEFNGDVAAWYAANSAFKHAGVGDGSPVPRKVRLSPQHNETRFTPNEQTAPANRRLDSRSQVRPLCPSFPARAQLLMPFEDACFPRAAGRG